MIPKIIHYCWFGGNPLPEDAKKCIASWKKYLPYYEIKEWNETNFDLNCCDYIKEAYQAKKWAFVSDYARFKILYENGGLYFDTDVEIIKPLDDIVAKGPFMGKERGTEDASLIKTNPGLGLAAAPGLGLAAAPGLGLYKEILDYYNSQHFMDTEGNISLETVVERTTGILKKHGYIGNNQIEEICGIYIYPPEYFCPMSFITGKTTITENTRTIHHYSASWQSPYAQFVTRLKYIIGPKLTRRICNIKHRMFFQK